MNLLTYFDNSCKIGDARLLYDLMVVTLEKLPSVGVVARATIGSLIVLARTILEASISSHTRQVRVFLFC